MALRQITMQMITPIHTFLNGYMGAKIYRRCAKVRHSYDALCDLISFLDEIASSPEEISIFEV